MKCPSPLGSRRARKNEMNTALCTRLLGILIGSAATSTEHGHVEDGQCAHSSLSNRYQDDVSRNGNHPEINARELSSIASISQIGFTR